MSYKSFFVLLLFAASLFLTVGALSGELKVKLDATIRNKVFEAVKSSFRSVYYHWDYSIDYDDIWLKYTRWGRVDIYSISSSPTMTMTDTTITVHYPYLTYQWKYDYCYIPLWIAIKKGDGENRYTINNIKLTFTGMELPTVTHSGKLSNLKLPYVSRFDYSSVSWSYWNDHGKPYGSRLFEGDGKNKIITSIVHYFQHSTSWRSQFQSIANEINRYNQYSLPAIKRENPIIKSSDTEVSKKLNDLYISVTGSVEYYSSSGIPYCYNILLNYAGKDMSTRSPYYNIELRLRDVPFVQNITWSKEHQKQALERLKTNTEFNRAFIDGINHFGKNITSYRIVNGTSDLISSKTVLHTSLLFDDKFKQNYEGQNYLVLKWNFKIVEVLQDRSRAVAYQGTFRIHTKNVGELVTKNRTTYQIKPYIPVYLEGSVDDIQPYIGEQKTRDAVERYISFMNKTIDELASSEAENSDYLQIVVPKNYRITTEGHTDWNPKYNNEGKRELDIDFFANVKEV